ncbi:MAG: hypothetical protein JXB49_14860 [Bacteroidales bacterium]|nr:hypothetical protein [Bacteroidales bacterium]
MLTVEIISFAYKNGIPEDKSGNFGGFIFDCRYLNNPGRYEEYKLLTGKDQPVKNFFMDDPIAEDFFTHSFALVRRAIENYIERNFEHLQVCFGCTGGQHRSVYSAERLATFLKHHNKINVVLHHREMEKF